MLISRGVLVFGEFSFVICLLDYVLWLQLVMEYGITGSSG